MVNVTDKKNNIILMQLVSSALGSTHRVDEFVEAGHRVNSDDGATNAGKKLSAVMVVKNAKGTNAPRLYLATGGLPEDDWNVTDTSLPAITPAYSSNFPAPVVGKGTDIKPNYNNNSSDGIEAIASVPFPIVLQADLLSLANVVNYFEYSGKKRGSVVIIDLGTFLGYAIATGSEVTSPWVIHDGTVLTPSTDAVITPTSTEHADYKPTARNVTSITSVDFPLVSTTDLADKDYAPMYSIIETPLTRLSEKAVISDDGGNKLALVYCLDGSGIITWYDLGGNAADITPS